MYTGRCSANDRGDDDASNILERKHTQQYCSPSQLFENVSQLVLHARQCPDLRTARGIATDQIKAKPRGKKKENRANHRNTNQTEPNLAQTTREFRHQSGNNSTKGKHKSNVRAPAHLGPQLRHLFPGGVHLDVCVGLLRLQTVPPPLSFCQSVFLPQPHLLDKLRPRKENRTNTNTAVSAVFRPKR